MICTATCIILDRWTLHDFLQRILASPLAACSTDGVALHDANSILYLPHTLHDLHTLQRLHTCLQHG